MGSECTMCQMNRPLDAVEFERYKQAFNLAASLGQDSFKFERTVVVDINYAALVVKNSHCFLDKKMPP